MEKKEKEEIRDKGTGHKDGRGEERRYYNERIETRK